MYYRGAYAAIIVYDVCRQESFNMLSHWHEVSVVNMENNWRLTVDSTTVPTI